MHADPVDRSAALFQQGFTCSQALVVRDSTPFGMSVTDLWILSCWESRP
jgi:hypothetical protein